MPGWLTALLLFVAACWIFTIVAQWFARRYAIPQASGSDAGSSLPGGSEHGALGVYFEKISEFEAAEYESFFVTVIHEESQKFVQVSFGLTKEGTREWQFDMPLNKAQSQHEDRCHSKPEVAVFRSKSTLLRACGFSTLRFKSAQPMISSRGG